MTKFATGFLSGWFLICEVPLYPVNLCTFVNIETRSLFQIWVNVRNGWKYDPNVWLPLSYHDLYGALQGILRSAWLGRFCGVKTWNSIFRRVNACTTSSACGVKVQNEWFTTRECVITWVFFAWLGDFELRDCVHEYPPLNSKFIVEVNYIIKCI